MISVALIASILSLCVLAAGWLWMARTLHSFRQGMEQKTIEQERHLAELERRIEEIQIAEKPNSDRGRRKNVSALLRRLLDWTETLRGGERRQTGSSGEAGASDKHLMVILGVVVGLFGLIVIVLSTKACGKPAKNHDLSVAWNVAPGVPIPIAQSTPPSAAKSPPRVLAIHLDLSEPFSGFLPPEPTAESSGLRTLVQQVPNQLMRVSGHSDSQVSWWGVASAVEPIPEPRPLRRAHFVGSESRLDLSINQILQGFDSGKIQSAVLITDLISTEELTGALGVAKELSDWMSSQAVLTGVFHAGLLGVRAPYWGARIGSERCPTGCWFSEQAKTWKPLTKQARAPFYILVLGRTEREVREIGLGLKQSATKAKLEVQWELLNEAVMKRQLDPTSCRFHREGMPAEKQFALVRKEDGRFSCRQDDRVSLRCGMPKKVLVAVDRAVTSWPSVAEAGIEGNDIVIDLDCERLRRHPPASKLIVSLHGKPETAGASPFAGWSTESDESEAGLHQTLQLQAFLEKARPQLPELVVTSSALLKGVEDGPR